VVLCFLWLNNEVLGAFLCQGSDFGGFSWSLDVVLVQVVGGQTWEIWQLPRGCRGRA
jgi:hypothetical protein